MLKIHLTAKARQDLKDILTYGYQTWGQTQADDYYNQLLEKTENLKKYPDIGVECDYIRLGYRKLQVQKHIIFYKVENNTILIVRVLHEKMDYQEHL